MGGYKREIEQKGHPVGGNLHLGDFPKQTLYNQKPRIGTKTASKDILIKMGFLYREYVLNKFNRMIVYLLKKLYFL